MRQIFFLLLLITSACYGQEQNKEGGNMNELFEFKGEWQTRIILKEFARLNNPSLNRYDTDLEKGDFGLYIHDVEDMNPDLLPEQINAIHFLQQNQKEVLENVYQYIIAEAIPWYETFMSKEDYPEAFPEMNSVNDLSSFIGVNEIVVQHSVRDGYAYIVLGFTSMADNEHGLYIVMHKLRAIEHGTMSGLDMEKTAADMRKGQSNINVNRLEVVEINSIIKPHPKYGKLKPWQESTNRYFPNRFVRNDDFEQLKEFLETHPKEDSIYHYTSNLLAIVVRMKKQQFIDYLIERKPPRVMQAFEVALRQLDFRLMHRLLDIAPDIKERRGYDSFLYKVLMAYYKHHDDTTLRNDFEAIVNSIFDKGCDPFLEAKYSRNALFGYKYFENKIVKNEIHALVKMNCKKHGIEIPKKYDW